MQLLACEVPKLPPECDRSVLHSSWVFCDFMFGLVHHAVCSSISSKLMNRFSGFVYFLDSALLTLACRHSPKCLQIQNPSSFDSKLPPFVATKFWRKPTRLMAKTPLTRCNAIFSAQINAQECAGVRRPHKADGGLSYRLAAMLCWFANQRLAECLFEGCNVGAGGSCR